jgi:hypothetical protein
MDNVNTVKCEKFDWEALLGLIKDRKVIPVIGQGLLRTRREDGSEQLLYDFLAEQILKASGKPTLSGENANFVQACDCYFEDKNAQYKKLIALMKEALDGVELIAPNPLSKLAKIEVFNVFFTTAYDGFLPSTIEEIRNTRVESLGYTISQKRQGKIGDELFGSIKNDDCSLIYHLLGKLKGSVSPAFSGKETLETIMAFQKNLEENYDLNLLRLMEGRTFLFIGCGYDELLFQSFIRCFANRPNWSSDNSSPFLFVGGHINRFGKPFSIGLSRILKNYNVQVIDICDSEAFVDCLCEKFSPTNFRVPDCLQQKEPENREESPVAFISFHGGNRKAAERLAENFKKDGIKVWYDDIDLEPGDDVDETIEKYIEECPAFIPLISQESKKLSKPGDLKYHCQEWEKAFSNNKTGKNPRKILPVVIDNTGWRYKRFDRLVHTNIDDGKKGKGYKKILNKLMKIKREQENTSHTIQNSLRKVN